MFPVLCCRIKIARVLRDIAAGYSGSDYARPRNATLTLHYSVEDSREQAEDQQAALPSGMSDQQEALLNSMSELRSVEHLEASLRLALESVKASDRSLWTIERSVQLLKQSFDSNASGRCLSISTKGLGSTVQGRDSHNVKRFATTLLLALRKRHSRPSRGVQSLRENYPFR